MSFIKHNPFFLNDIAVPITWAEDVELPGQAHLMRKEDNSVVQISISVPHLTPEEINVELVGSTMTVSGNHKEQDRSDRFERHYDVQVADASQIKANLYNGVLVLTIEKGPRFIQKIPIEEKPPPDLIPQLKEEEKHFL